jgi:hypothetical protein
MQNFALVEFYLHPPIRNAVEVWNADGHHVNVRCSDGNVYTMLQDEIRRTVIPYGWKMEAEFPYRASIGRHA